MDQVPLMIPRMPTTSDLIPYLRRIDSSKVYSNFGSLHSELTQRLSEHFGVNSENIALCSNATVAISGAVITSSRTDSVWDCPSWTFTASPAAVLSTNRKLRFRDVDSDGRVNIHDDCSNLLDVLPFGEGPNFTRYRKNEVNVVIDAAASFDALSRPGALDKKDAAFIVSMHATKLVGAGEGGIFISEDTEWISRFKSWINFGMNGLGDRRSYSVGTNAKLSEYACAVGLASMDLWGQTKSKILANSQLALNLSQKFHLIPTSAMLNGYATPYWIVQLENARAKELLKACLVSAGIQFRDWWVDGCHTMPAYESFSVGTFSSTVEIAKTSLGLPFHFFLTDSDWERIGRALENFRTLA
jgi:dTDP-4-amino-4,6-dideoxygalactose transaminase